MSLLTSHFYRFGEFTIDSDQRVLLRNGKPIPLTPKAFDTLLILVENSGRIVEREELMNRVWPDSFVEESNLSFNIQQLRKSLRDNARRPRYIETVARRGYRFIADVEEVLSNGSEIGGSVSPKVEITDDRLPYTSWQGAEDGSAAKAAREPAQSLSENTAREVPLPLPESSLAAAESRRTHPRRNAVIVALLAILAIGALLGVKLLSGKEPETKTPALSDGGGLFPLKLEKISGAGQSGLVAISPDAKLLAYVQTINKESSVWLRVLATNANVEITPATGAIHALAFDNDSENLLFVKGESPALYRVSTHGGVPVMIARGLQGKFAISPNNREIAFVRLDINPAGERRYSLVVADSDGTNERAVFESSSKRIDAPVFSPDGSAIICACGNEFAGLETRLIEINIANGESRELGSERFARVTKIAFLPDKSGFLLCGRQLGESCQLWRVSYPGANTKQITEGLSNYLDLSVAAIADKAVATEATRRSDVWIGPAHEPKSMRKITQAIDNFCWTPNGRIVYSSTTSGNRDLWIMQPDGAEQRQLTNVPAVDGTPVVAIDGRQIVFMSNRTGSFQVWRMDIDGTNQLQITRGPATNFPSISPDGKWVIYNTTDNSYAWRISIDGGEPVRLTDYRSSFPQVSPKGEWVACLTRTESKREIAIFPFAGGSPVKTLELGARIFTGTRILWSLDGNSVVFAAEEDGSAAIFRQPLNGGKAQKLADFAENDLLDFGYSFDGKLLAVTRGDWQHDILLINDLSQIR